MLTVNINIRGTSDPESDNKILNNLLNKLSDDLTNQGFEVNAIHTTRNINTTCNSGRTYVGSISA